VDTFAFWWWRFWGLFGIKSDKPEAVEGSVAAEDVPGCTAAEDAAQNATYAAHQAAQERERTRRQETNRRLGALADAMNDPMNDPMPISHPAIERHMFDLTMKESDQRNGVNPPEPLDLFDGMKVPVGLFDKTIRQLDHGEYSDDRMNANQTTKKHITDPKRLNLMKPDKDGL